MGVFHSQYPQEFRKVIGHAERLAKVFARMEAKKHASAWVVGRSGELRTVVSCAIADWRSGARDKDATRDAIASYVDTLHRDAISRMDCDALLECCRPDEAITAQGEEWTREVRAIADSMATGRLHLDASTAPVAWVDGPEVLARLKSELGRVDIAARMMARQIGTSSVTVEDLQAFGREGLLDAARSFDELRGIPFAQWATQRIRNAMLDGVRRWGPLPRRVRQEIRALESSEPMRRHIDTVEAGGGPLRGASEGADTALRARLGAIATVLTLGTTEHDADANSAGRHGGSPEEMVGKAELFAVVRDVVGQLKPAERALMEGVYFRGETLAQVAATLGLSKSGASRMHGRAIEKLESELRTRSLDVDR